MRTPEGPIVRYEMQSRLLLDSETEHALWQIQGEPDVNLQVDLLNGASSSLTVATQIVNRIADVLAAPSGYLTLDAMPAARFRARLDRPSGD